MMTREERLEQMISLIGEVDAHLAHIIDDQLGDEEEFSAVIDALLTLKEELEYL